MSVTDSNASVAFLVATLMPTILVLCINVVVGIIALNMAKKRGLRTVPAFFAGLFGSFITLFFIAMFPVKE